jgi:hypothetical protein
MKARFLTSICIIALALAGTSTSRAQDKPSTVVKAVDAVCVRPVCFTSTVVGSVLYVLSLPVTAPLKKAKPAREMLITKPAKATFKRPLGDMDAMSD